MLTNLSGPVPSHGPQGVFTACVSLEPQVPSSIEWLPSFPKIQLQEDPENSRDLLSTAILHISKQSMLNFPGDNDMK